MPHRQPNPTLIPTTPDPDQIAREMPAFARAIRGLAQVPKADVDASIARERAAKKLARQASKRKAK